MKRPRWSETILMAATTIAFRRHIHVTVFAFSKEHFENIPKHRESVAIFAMRYTPFSFNISFALLLYGFWCQRQQNNHWYPFDRFLPLKEELTRSLYNAKQ